MSSAVTAVDTADFRAVLGHFCTGVTVVTGHDEQPFGFACQAFAALSLAPPLVLCCPRRNSRSWQAIAETGRFGVNVLTEDQRSVSEAFGSPDGDRFASVDWHLSPGGSPILRDALTWVDCAIRTVLDGGDHLVVVGTVTQLGPVRDAKPLLFYRGGYTGMDASAESVPAAWLADLLTWQGSGDWL
ncbi:3-hydroxy-9,10-secoandrosta-1,3,5(10)-triene-9,17-dione monooxygenase reductase component [Tamaricihabitans halophyticus]|uniref:3-hydroxy-9,10-secoandrosta-1,3,5(10)-triene-9, 17-dione monooxygenase reductase component n=1 Tax=Tamaricihabitans halophyticus TaxID=1262583 RepID=A0A4R2QEH9_9PSEU|nr:3-hydroxy-9,10-secoandrosta-1,3,5(10)-triene-9,17-dione monooxygenase reductase subunit [Tamaricihabitans halophyticus]TCP45365.1 3-hydroxy-9,10-secoandrosta-1,3,5(10)-triene-9,17-dione monooxygenase reductase component [Tamaricihabitans halophyticus]